MSGFALALALMASPAAAVSAPAVRPVVIERTLLKALPGTREALAEYIVANWFAMDALAVTQGLFTGYRLLENVASDGDWDLAVEVGYPSAAGYDDPEIRRGFEAIRARHSIQPINGKSLSQLGRIIRSERVRPRDEG